MRDLAAQPLREVDDLDGLKRTPFDTHSAANAKLLGNEANGRAGLDLNTYFSIFVNWTLLGALLPALLRLALIWIDNGDSELVV